MVMFMLMSVAAAAGGAVVMTVCMGVFTAAGTVMVVLMCMSMAAVAGIIVTVLMPVLHAAFLFPGGTVFSGTCSRVDFHLRFHGCGRLTDLIQQCIRIFRCDAQLTGRKCERYLLNLGHRRDLSLHCCRAVGTVQIFDRINFSDCGSGDPAVRM